MFQEVGISHTLPHYLIYYSAWCHEVSILLSLKETKTHGGGQCYNLPRAQPLPQTDTRAQSLSTHAIKGKKERSNQNTKDTLQTV